MLANLPTQRLSPKHQVTLPRGARGLQGAEEVGSLCAMPHRMKLPDGSGTVPVVILLTEQELQQRENDIRAREDLDAMNKERRIARLNGHVRQLAIDAHRRVVLPKHFVEHIAAEKDVFLFSNNASVLVWNPHDWLRYAEPVDDDDDDDFLVI
jgi:DNA-binding transcriptional regulator/RsmH inhibitor MraZ